MTEYKWIPAGEKSPQDYEIVNIVYVNHKPAPYYEHIKDKPLVATAVYCRGLWYWYSTFIEDNLREYGNDDIDIIHEDIEVIAWIPLPIYDKPYVVKSNQDSKLDKAIKILRNEYDKTLPLGWVHNPIAYALYQTWKQFDD